MSIILLHGNQSFLLKKEKERILADYRKNIGGSIAFINLLGIRDAKNLNQLKSKLTTGSLFGEKELVIARLEESLSETIISFLSNLSPNLSLLLELPVKLPSANPLLKTIKKLDGEIRLFEITAAQSQEALKVAGREYLLQEKIELSGYLLNKLIDYSQGNWWLVFTALDQAILLTKNRGEKLSDEQLAELWDIPEEQSIFRLFDAIGRGDQTGAISLLYDKLGKDRSKTAEEVESVLGFTNLMARQLRQLIAVKGGIGLKEAEKEWSIPGFAYGKLKNQAISFSEGLLKNAFWKLTDIQQKAKSGLYSPLMLVDFFVIHLISQRQGSVGNTY